MGNHVRQRVVRVGVRVGVFALMLFALATSGVSGASEGRGSAAQPSAIAEPSTAGPVSGTATPLFKDSGGSYSLKMFAADPAVNHAPNLPTYTKVPPGALACPTPSGGTGRASDPMPNAVLGNPLDAVTSLAPRDMALGQIVPFEVEIKGSGSTSPEGGKIQIVGQWSTKTESRFDFGYDPSFGVYCAFIDTADSDNVSLAPTTKVDSFSSRTIEVPGRDQQIEGSINVSGLSNGETAVLEIWVVLKNTLPPNAKGNVHGTLQNATTCVTQNPCTGGTRINTGTQTVPLLRVKEFRTVTADVSVQKRDDPDPVSPGGTLTYTVNVTNTS